MSAEGLAAAAGKRGIGTGLLPTEWQERVGERFELARSGTLRAAIDGEPFELETPLVCRVEPAALRVLVPPRR